MLLAASTPETAEKEYGTLVDLIARREKTCEDIAASRDCSFGYPQDLRSGR